MWRLLGCILALAAPAASALELKPTGVFELNFPSSLHYDPTFCGLWIANEGPEAILMTLEGLELRRVSSDMARIKAIAIEGDHLLVADGYGAFQRISKDGMVLGAPFQIEAGWADTEGLVVAEDGTIITVEDDPEYMTWMGSDGKIERRVDTLTFSAPLSEAQGIARDPRTGHLLVVDDWEGTNSLYEFDKAGALLDTVPLIEFGTDPEGVAIRAGSNQVFIAFDQGSKLMSFDYTPTLPAGADPLPSGGDCMLM